MQEKTTALLGLSPFPPQQQQTLFDEHDEFSKKRISLHKVAIHNPTDGTVTRYDYHMVIIDLCMTINITLGENAIINLVKSMK